MEGCYMLLKIMHWLMRKERKERLNSFLLILLSFMF